MLWPRRSSQAGHHEQLQPMAGHRVTASPGRGSHGNGAGVDLNNTARSLPLCDRQGECILPVTSAYAWTPSCHSWHNPIETADLAREVFMTCSLHRVWTPGREKALDSITNPLSCPVSLITFNSHLLQIIWLFLCPSFFLHKMQCRKIIYSKSPSKKMRQYFSSIPRERKLL